MKEDLLHFVWKFRKYPALGLRTVDQQPVIVHYVGVHNHFAGPDFFNAQVSIQEQRWAGNVEIHIKSSDWYHHNHQEDSNYDAVILHVVWEDDVAVFRPDGSQIPTIALKEFISEGLLANYKNLMSKKPTSFINCGKGITQTSSFKFANWKERLYIERLEQKSTLVLSLLKRSKNDWEEVLFILLLRNFGSKVNGDFFFDLAKRIPFAVVRKLQNKPVELEALLFGLAGLLETEKTDTHYRSLVDAYQYLCHKYQLDATVFDSPRFFGLRPPNFPTIRLSQFAQLYAQRHALFAEAIVGGTPDFYTLLSSEVSPYWQTHYTFDKVSKKTPKKTTKKFIDLLIINTILPLKFCYHKHKGSAIDDNFWEPIRAIAAEKNSILNKYSELGLAIDNAKDSQALLQLYTNYCSKNNCLQCAVGSELLTLNA